MPPPRIAFALRVGGLVLAGEWQPGGSVAASARGCRLWHAAAVEPAWPASTKVRSGRRGAAKRGVLRSAVWRLRAVGALAAAAVTAIPGGARAAPVSPGLEVSPSIVAGTPGSDVTVWVLAPAGAHVSERLYAFDPATGRLGPPDAETGWLRVTPGGPPSRGGAEPYTLAVEGPAAQPARDAYLDVVFTAAAPVRAGGTGAQMAAGALVAFRGAAAPPAGWTAALAGPRVVWLGSGTWSVAVRGAPGGWIAPSVTARLRGGSSSATLRPILPGAVGQAVVRLRAGRPGVALLSVRVQSGTRAVTFRRRVLVFPAAPVLGALGGLGALALARARLRGPRGGDAP